MKKLLIMMAAMIVVVSCRKTSEETELTRVMEVEEKNMSVIAKNTSTGCRPCGGYGYTKFNTLKEQYKGKAAFLAMRSGVGMSEIYHVKSTMAVEFELKTSTPSFSTNFIQGNYDAVDEHFNSTVIANSNYKLSVSGNLLSLTTTTKFFSNANGQFFIVPYVVVDGIIGAQSGHDDSPNTVLNSNVAGVAMPSTHRVKEYLGYKLADGNIKEGYTVNLDYQYEVDPSWEKENIKVVLVILKKEGEKYHFVNAFSK